MTMTKLFALPIYLKSLTLNNFEKIIMKKLNLIAFIFTAFLLTVTSSTVKAQEEMPPADEPKQNFDKQNRPNLLRELDLSAEQIQQIRRIHADKRPLIREAQQKVREANRDLDEAIYADDANETDIKTRLKDAQNAQAEVAKIRSMTEFAVRKVLTPEQLVKFREVRQRFIQNLENRPARPNNRPMNNQNQRFNNRQRRLPPNN